METPSNQLFKINEFNEIYNLPNVNCMYSEFSDRPNLTKDDLIHLISGKPLADLSDGEYIHLIQLDKEALDYIRNNMKGTT